jgi:hypothetical protein
VKLVRPRMHPCQVSALLVLIFVLGGCTDNAATASIRPTSSHSARTDSSTTSSDGTSGLGAWVISAVHSTGGRQGELVSVSCPAVADCYAAGFSFLGDGLSYPPVSPGLNERPVVEHFNGARWSMMPLPSTPGILNRVTCVTPQDCIAVGGTELNYQTNGTSLVESFNGHRWSVVPSPNLGAAAFAGTPAAGAPPGQIQNVLEDVACRGVAECFAVGDASVVLNGDSIVVEPITVRFDGTSWAATTLTTALAEFSDIACDSEVCLAVGSSSNDLRTEVPIAATLSGTTWMQTAAPVGEFAIRGVTCAATTCRVLTYSRSVGVYSGGSWTAQNLPTVPAQMTTWYGLTCFRATQCVAVGQDNSAEGRTALNPLAWDKTLVAILSNGRWSIESSPNGADMNNALLGVACPAWHKCVTVGYSQVPSGLNAGLVSPLALTP